MVKRFLAFVSVLLCLLMLCGCDNIFTDIAQRLEKILKNDSEEVLNQESDEILRDFLQNQAWDGQVHIAVLADVTGDGQNELVAVIFNQEQTLATGYVFGVFGDGIELLERIDGGQSHATGFFGWYIKKSGSGYHLVHETFGMWQGYGQVTITEYYLDSSGNRIAVNAAAAASEKGEMVSDAVWDRYVYEGTKIRDGSCALHYSSTNLGGSLMPLDVDLILETNERFGSN